MTLIKNNIKLLLRCKALILIVLVMVLVTGLLSAVFKDLMTDSFEIRIVMWDIHSAQVVNMSR